MWSFYGVCLVNNHFYLFCRILITINNPVTTICISYSIIGIPVVLQDSKTWLLVNKFSRACWRYGTFCKAWRFFECSVNFLFNNMLIYPLNHCLLTSLSYFVLSSIATFEISNNSSFCFRTTLNIAQNLLSILFKLKLFEPRIILTRRFYYKQRDTKMARYLLSIQI